MTTENKMRAVVFHSPYKVAVEERPIPKIQDAGDIVVKVTYTALCGSDLHTFRGIEPAGTGFVMGHEVTGEAVEVGSGVKSIQKGDMVGSEVLNASALAVGSVSWVDADYSHSGECFYCKQGFSSRCEKSVLFGCDHLDGAQAEYVRIPNADGTVMKTPEGVEEKYLVLMADIFPTGYFAASNAFKGYTPEQISEQTVVLIGCGPVGLCALINALEFKPKHLLAVDSIPSRLELARSLGAEPWNFQQDREGLDKRVKELTNGRGADAVIEVVGLSPALRTGFDLLRPWGTISSVGVHNGELHDTQVVDETMTDAVNMVDEGDMDITPKTEEEYAQSMLTLRAIVSSKEAGVIIGKAGKNVADLRDETGVKAGVSKVVPGVHDRVLTVTGPLQGTARAYALVAKGLLEGAPQMGMGGIVSNNGTHPVRLLISHNQMGTIIGRSGLKIKHIQDASGVRMVAQKEMLPQSTERIVEVQGTPEGIEKAVWEIGKCLIDDWQRGTGTILYNPAVRASVGTTPVNQNVGNGYNSRPYNRTGNGADFSDQSGGYGRRSNPDTSNRGYPLVTEDGEEIQTQNISIPADMVGCIIGRGGSKITEIRRSSGARISIAKAPHDDTGERMFTIMGSAQANEKALYLLYENLEAEKTRRSQLPQE
ncbi:hypothetical protein APSETT445_003391 [Aspergillus pseudonomiae]